MSELKIVDSTYITVIVTLSYIIQKNIEDSRTMISYSIFNTY